MTSKSFAITLAAGFVLTSAALAQSMQSALPELDFLSASYTQTGGMDLDDNSGDLTVSEAELDLYLSKPIALTPGLTMIPKFSYSVTQLDFSDTGAFPIEDETLHSASLTAIFIQDFSDSPWFALGWTRAEMATDYQGISGDDFTFDVALGGGYRVSDTFMIGAGLVVSDLNGDENVYPGINFSWKPNDTYSLMLFGTRFSARYNVNECWYVSLDASSGGGTWNINDAAGQSRTIDLDSFWVGINTHHKLTESLWISAGLGYTFGNEIEIRANDGGNPRFSRDMDGAPLAQISLNLREW